MITRGQLHTKPYRDISGAALMTALCAAVALLLSISIVNKLQIFPQPFLTHIGALLNHHLIVRKYLINYLVMIDIRLVVVIIYISFIQHLYYANYNHHINKHIQKKHQRVIRAHDCSRS